jgi:hypothetical protein
VHDTVQAIPTHLRVADIDAAAELCGREWVALLGRGRTRAAALLRRFRPPTDLWRILRQIDDWADVDFALLRDAAAWFRDNDARRNASCSPFSTKENCARWMSSPTPSAMSADPPSAT